MSEQANATGFKFDFNEIKTRATVVIKNPKGVWGAIKADGESTQDLFKKYFVYIAALPALCGFIGMVLFGFPGAGAYLKVNVGASLVTAIFHYGLALAAPIIAGALSGMIAPKFGGSADQATATKLFVYASTASQLGGILSLVPLLGLLGIVASIYSLYTLYQGITPMVDVPSDKRIMYLIVMVVALIVVLGLINIVLSSALPSPFTSTFNPGDFTMPS